MGRHAAYTQGLISAKRPKSRTTDCPFTLLGPWLWWIAEAAIYFSELSEAFQLKSRVS
jgi:hypothetical protein